MLVIKFMPCDLHSITISFIFVKLILLPTGLPPLPYACFGPLVTMYHVYVHGLIF